MNRRLRAGILGCAFSCAAAVLSALKLPEGGFSVAVFCGMLGLLCVNVAAVLVTRKKDKKDREKDREQ